MPDDFLEGRFSRFEFRYREAADYFFAVTTVAVSEPKTA